MNPLFADILRRHLALPAEEQPEQRAEEGSYSERQEVLSVSKGDLGGPPWRCPNCHRLNTNDRKRCKNCQASKPNQTLCEVFAEEKRKDQTPFF